MMRNRGVARSLSEFSLIERYFADLTTSRADVVLGIGDDCALLDCQPGKQLAVSIDTLVSGVHFFPDVDPFTLGHKSLAVGLSDLAAMGAEPAWFTLALTLPQADPDWLKSFSQGLSSLASESGIQLVGGDTTHGPLTISIQVHGWVDPAHSIRRDRAEVGDVIFVSGTLGDAGAALQLKLGNIDSSLLSSADQSYLEQRLQQPTPRTVLGIELAGRASAGIDISDGLLADLGHITQRSGLGAKLQIDQLPLSPALQKLPVQQAIQLALTAGDDYELCFTANPGRAEQLQNEFAGEITRVGVIKEGSQIIACDETGSTVDLTDIKAGYDHFT